MKGSTLRDSFVFVVIISVVLAAIFVGQIGIETKNGGIKNSSQLIECIGTFRNDGMRLHLDIELKEKRRHAIPELNVLDQCTRLNIIIENPSLINWTQVPNIEARIPNLNFFSVDLITSQEKGKIEETELINQIGWKNLLFLENFKRTDIWASKIGFEITLNKHTVLLSYDAILNQNSIALTIRNLAQVNDIISDFSFSTVQLSLKYLSLSNCKIRNLPTSLTKELLSLKLINVEYLRIEEFVRKSEFLVDLTLTSKLTLMTFDLINILSFKNLTWVKFESYNLTLAQNVSNEGKERSLTMAMFNGCNFDKSFKENNGWQIFSNVKHLELADLNEPLDICDSLPSEKLNTLYIENSTVLISREDNNFKNLSLLTNLFLKDCQFDASFSRNFWKITPNLKYLAVVTSSNSNSNMENPNPELLDTVLSNLVNLEWIHMTNFNWSSSNRDALKKMSTFLQLTKGDLKGKEENFIIRKIDHQKWRGWKYVSSDEYDKQLLEYLARSDTPTVKYSIQKLELSLPKGDTRNLYEWEKYMARIDKGVMQGILSDNQLLSVNESWISGRNISIVVDGRILLDMTYEDSGEGKVTIMHFPTLVHKILNNVLGRKRNFTKLALAHLKIGNFDLLQCERLKKLSLMNLSFEHDDVSHRTILEECGELTELIIIPTSNNVTINIDLRNGLKSKVLKKLVLGGLNISLTSGKSHYATLEDLYLDNIDLHSTFHQNFWKFYPNLKRIGIGRANSGQPNPSFLKSIIDNLKHIEWIYFKNFNWTQASLSANDEVSLEMENFVFGTAGKLIGNETHFVLQKLPGTVWTGRGFGILKNEHRFLEFQELRRHYFYKDFENYAKSSTYY